MSRRDRFLHQPRFRDWNWVETNWFCFVVPEEAMVGHLRLVWRPTLGVVGANVFVYSNRGLNATGALADDTHEDRFAMSMPPPNLDDYRLHNGISVRQAEAFQRWEVRYDGIDGTGFDLEYTALMPPVEVGETTVPGAGEGYGRVARTIEKVSTNAFSCNGFVDWDYQGEPGIGEYRWHWGVRELREWLAEHQ